MDRSNLEFHFTAVSEDPVEPWMGVIIIGPSKVWNTTFRTGSTSVEAPVLLPPVPALFAPSPAIPDVPSLETVAGFDGVALPTRETGRSGVPPSGRINTAIVDWDVLDNIAAASTTPGSLAVWASTVSGAEQSRTVLSQAGITIIAERSRGELLRHFDDSASARSLRLTLVIGILAALLTVLVLILVSTTSLRSRSRDLAALRMAGVSRRTVTRSATMEQAAVVIVAALVGMICGYIGSRLALPILPLFTTPSEVFKPDLQPMTLAILSVGIFALLIFVTTVVLLGRQLSRRSNVGLVRQPGQ